jgi:O-antigen ligase
MKTFTSMVAGLILISPLYPRLAVKVFGRFSGNDRGSAESRLPQFEMAYDIFTDNPLFGIGLNNYTEVMHDYDFTEEGVESLTHHPVHNIYLHIAAEMGIFGIAAFIWFTATIFFEGIKYIISNKCLMIYVVTGMLAGIVAFLVHGLVDTASLGSKLFVFVWFFMGVIFAIKEIPLAKTESIADTYPK